MRERDLAPLQRALERLEGSYAAGDCLRSVLMKPEHLDWIDAIWTLLDRAVEAAPVAEEDR